MGKHAVIAFLSMAVWLCGCRTVKPEVSEMSEDKVLFISNYMDVFGASSMRGGQQIPGLDVFPFIRRLEAGDQATREAEINAMRAYGFDGMQVWPSYGSAASWLKTIGRMELEEPFYVIPQIAGVAHHFYPSYEAFVEATVAYLREYGDHPNMLRIDGRPLLSSWGGPAYLKDMERFREDVRAGEVDFSWLRTTDTGVDGPRLDGLAKIHSSKLEAYNSWRNLRTPDNIRTVTEALNAGGEKCEIWGSIWPGYDNRNRMFRNNYRVYNGTGSYIDSLEAGLTAGLKRMILVTWNDGHESACMPSWRSPGGLEVITRFYKAVYSTDRSPFARTRIVVAYQPEQLLGDNLRLQMIALPDQTGTAWSGRLELRDLDDRVILSQDLKLVPNGNHALVRNVDFDSLRLPLDCAVLSPCLISDGRVIRLSPLLLRTDNLRTLPPLVIDTDRVAEDVAVSCTFVNQNGPSLQQKEPVQVQVRIQAPVEIRQVQLADSTQILLDAETTTPEETMLFLALDNWSYDEVVNLELNGAEFVWLYGARECDEYDTGSLHIPLEGKHACLKLGKGKGFRPQTPNAVLAIRTSDPQQAILSLKGNKLSREVRLSLYGLATRPELIPTADDSGTLRVRLAEDGHSLPTLPELSGSSLEVRAFLPNLQQSEPWRSIACQVELDDGRIAYSRPLLWIRSDDTSKTVPVSILHSGVAYDDLVEDGSTVSRNDFSRDQVRQLDLPAWRMPEFNYAFDEGRGWFVNDGGCYTSRGYGWLFNKRSRQAKWGAGSGDPVWTPGLRGTAMDFGPESRLSLRSGSFPVGAFTVLAWTRIGQPGATIRLFSDSHLTISVSPEGHLITRLRKNRLEHEEVQSETSLSFGVWQQFAVTYDLQALRLYLNGSLVGVRELPPLQSRLNSLPYFGSPDKPDDTESLQDDSDHGGHWLLDEAKIAGYAWSSEAIAQDYASKTETD